MKKRLSILFSFVLILAIVQPASASTGGGNFHLTALSAEYEGSSVVITSVIANTGNGILKEVSNLEVDVLDKDDNYVGGAILTNDPSLFNLVLAPGESTIWTLTIEDFPSADLSSFTLEYFVDFSTGVEEFTSGIKIVVDNKYLPESKNALIQNGTTLVPMRAIFESLGAEVKWDGKTKTVTAIRGNDKLVLRVGEKYIEMNGTKVAVDVPAKVVNNSTLVPLRIISESFDGVVSYGKTGKATTISITTY